MIKYKWLLFDMDGTLFNTEKAEKNALNNTFKQMGLNFEPQYIDIFRKIAYKLSHDFKNGDISLKKLITKRSELFFKAIGISCNPHDFNEKYLSNIATCTDTIKGAKENIQLLDIKFKIALISNGFKAAQIPRLENSKIRKYINVMVFMDEVGAAKPNKEIFDKAFEKMGNPSTNEVLLIGDSLTSDIEGGSNYGIDTCWFNPERKTNSQPNKVNFEIQKLDELSIILRAH